jgi:colanic acid biosynthesis glycosyl transferase WcaI
LKILIVTQYFWPESFKVNDLATELARRGHLVTVYTGFPNYPRGHFFDGYSIDKGPYRENFGAVEVIRCPMVPRLWANGPLRKLGLILNFISFAIIGSLFCLFQVKGRYDRIFMYEVSPIFSAFPALVLRAVKNAPMIIWITDLWPESLSATGIVKNKNVLDFVALFVKFIYRHTDLIYTSSKGFIGRIEALGVPSAKIKFWPQWAESLFLADRSDKPSVDLNLPSGFVVLFTGNIGTSQDMPTLVGAAEILKAHKDIHFVILGDGLEKARTEAQVAKLGLKDTFHLLGRKPMEMMPAYYEKAGALLVSLKKDDLFSVTLPAKMQSYMASGNPILACLDGEGADLVREWNAGLSCPAGNALKLAETVLQFSKLPPERRIEMGGNAFRCYQALFDREKLIRELETDFENLRFPDIGDDFISER